MHDLDEVGDVLDADDGEEFGRDGFSLRELWTFTGPAWMVSIAYLGKNCLAPRFAHV